MIQKDLEVAIYTAFREAEDRRHEYVTLEHLLYVLCFDKTTRVVLKNSGVNIDRLKGDLDTFLNGEEKLPKGILREPAQTSAFQRVIQRAIFHVQSSGQDEVDGANVLVAIFSESDSHAVYFLAQQEVTRLDIISYISHGDDDDSEGEESDADWETDFGDEEGRRKKVNPLEEYCVNLNLRAAEGFIDPLIGRGPEVERTIQVLCRRRKNNPI